MNELLCSNFEAEISLMEKNYTYLNKAEFVDKTKNSQVI